MEGLLGRLHHDLRRDAGDHHGDLHRGPQGHGNGNAAVHAVAAALGTAAHGAGDGHAITGIAIGVSEGYVRYQVHLLNGGWLPEVDGYDIDDDENGYAGNGRTPIDALKAVFYTPDGYEYQCLYMQVSPKGMDEYYPVQIDDQTVNGQDGYAGCFGKYIDKVQLWVE
mgnify:CR=1 FL=1